MIRYTPVFRINERGYAGYVDARYSVRLLFVSFLTLADAVLTMHLVQMGAWEANPLMRYALETGPAFFITTKYFLTASGFLFLIRNGHLRVFGGSLPLKEMTDGLILFYLGLVIYEIKLYYIV